MATTKIWPVRTNLGKVNRYAADRDKTAEQDKQIGAVLGYATATAKTERQYFVTGVNCNARTATQEMIRTKKQWRKEGGILAFHGEQSFAPGETTPEEAHAIGVEFARRMWGERFQVVVSTHLDRAHLHNHFVLNSVSLADGKRYYDNKKTYYGQIRVISDQLCREYGLSVIDKPQGRGKSYDEAAAEKQGAPTVRGMVRQDIDALLPRSFTFKMLLENLAAAGYELTRVGKSYKNISIRPPGGKRSARLNSLGDGYTEDDLHQRIALLLKNQPDPWAPEPSRPDTDSSPPLDTFHLPGMAVLSVRCYRIKHRPLPPYRPRLTRFQALYLKYLYLLGKTKRRPLGASSLLRRDILRMYRYQRQFLYLHHNRISDSDSLHARRGDISLQVDALTAQRKPLYRERRNATGDAAAALSGEIGRLTAARRSLRQELRLCDNILESEESLRGKLAELEQQKQMEQRSKNPQHRKGR